MVIWNVWSGLIGGGLFNRLIIAYSLYKREKAFKQGSENVYVHLFYYVIILTKTTIS